MHIEEIIPSGHDNAITMREIELLTGLRNRDIRRYISDARKKGILIINLQDGNGYFKPTMDESALVKRFIHQESSRAVDIFAGIGNARSWIADFERGAFDGEQRMDMCTQKNIG